MKRGLVLEGGAMRGLFTAGVLDVLMEHGVKSAVGGDVAKYERFREWVGGVRNRTGAIAGESEVIANANVAVAYLLGAVRLFENVPTIAIGDVGVEGACPTMSVSVTVKDGEDAVECAAERVKGMFEATGDLRDWNGGAKLTPTVTVEGRDGATMRFNVVPGDGTAARVFLRLKVK